MSKFSGFDGPRLSPDDSEEHFSVRKSLNKEPRINPRMSAYWAEDFEKCTTKEDYEKYIKRYFKSPENPYLQQAVDRLDELEMAEVSYTSSQPHTHTPSSSHNRKTTHSRSSASSLSIRDWGWTAVFVIGVIALIGAIGYAIYQNKKPNVNIPRTPTHYPVTNPQRTPIQPSSPTIDNSTYQDNQEPTVIVEDIEEPINSTPQYQQKFKQCEACFGTTRCSGCGGGGQYYSVFSGNDIVDGRMVACLSCGGSGICPLCNGTGMMEDFGW